MENDKPQCPVCQSENGILGTSYAYFVCGECKTERYWTPDNQHPMNSGLKWIDACKASPWWPKHPSYKPES